MYMSHLLRTILLTFCLILHGCSCSSGSTRNALRVGVDPQWYPIDLSNQQPYVTGFCAEFLAEVAKYSGLEFEWINRNWDNLAEGLKEGKYEAILSSLEPYDSNRARYDFSNVFLSLGPVLLLPANAKEVELENLGGQLVGILTGDATVLILQKYPDIIVRNFSSIPELLQALVNGDIEAALLNRIPAVNFVRDLYAGKIKIASAPLTDAGLRMITLKGGAPYKLKQFNNSLEQLEKKKVLSALLKKWQLD
jgi:polar amino acid transport system substrate-binding protein